MIAYHFAHISQGFLVRSIGNHLFQDHLLILRGTVFLCSLIDSLPIYFLMPLENICFLGGKPRESSSLRVCWELDTLWYVFTFHLVSIDSCDTILFQLVLWHFLVDFLALLEITNIVAIKINEIVHLGTIGYSILSAWFYSMGMCTDVLARLSAFLWAVSQILTKV